MVARCVRVFRPTSITAPNILKPPYIVQKALPNPPFPFYELGKLPDELQYKKGSNLLPPKYHLGWIIDEEAFLVWAERLNALEYVQTADDEDPMLKEFGEDWSDSDDDDKSEQKPVVQQSEFVTQERKVDVFYTIQTLIPELVEPTGAQLPIDNYMCLVNENGYLAWALTLHNNHRTDKYPEDDIAKVRNVLKFDTPPKWLPELGMTEWKVLRRY